MQENTDKKFVRDKNIRLIEHKPREEDAAVLLISTELTKLLGWAAKHEFFYFFDGSVFSVWK